MVRVRLRYLMNFSRITGRREEEVDLPDGSTVGDMFAHLERVYGEGMRSALARGGVVLLNGRYAETTSVLADGDEAVVSYPAGGG